MSRDRLELRIDRNDPIIEDQLQLQLSGEPVVPYVDLRSSPCRRAFSLRGELETGKTEATS